MYKEVNVKKTIANVKDKLKEFKMIHRLTGAPSYPELIDGFIEINTICSDNEVGRTALLKRNEIIESINKLSSMDYISLMYVRFIKKRRNKFEYYMGKWGYSYKEFYDMSDRAMLEFAEVYRNGELIAFDETDILTLLNDF